MSFLNWTLEAMATNSKDVETGIIPVHIAFLISDHAKTIQVKDSPRKANTQVHRKFIILNAGILETLTTTDFRLTFRTMQRLISQTESHCNADFVNSDEN